MLRTDTDPPAFEGGSLIPVATYLVVIVILSALVFVSPTESPPPILGMAWGVFLVALSIGVFYIEGVSPRSIVPSVRTLVPVAAVLGSFWGLYNLVAFGLALGGVIGFEPTWSRVAVHPFPYLAALFSSLLFTAIPEELVFRTYLQQRFIAVAGGTTRRAVAAGVVVVAVLFALFHLPRWFLATGDGISTALVIRLFGLVLAGIAYGIVYAVTGNLWLVALFHATMNTPPVMVSMSIPPEFHVVVGIIEYAALVSVVYLSVRLTGTETAALVRSQREPTS